MYIVKCNNCDTAIQVVLREVNINGTKVGYFICPECGEIYIGYVNSPVFLSLLRKRKEILQEMEEAGRNKNNRLYDRWYRKLEKCEKRLNRAENELKQKYKKIIETELENGGKEYGWK